jgi:(1->4)-alpha-D-glucan 1-alpha-D-glucosylmutase
VVLKLTVPGVPDFYQGTEFWDQSLVDPDNRRPVDFAAREASLEAGLPPAALARGWRDGRVKQAVITRVLGVRRQLPALFARGEYVPLAATGPCAERVVAFARRDEGAVLLVIVPRLLFGLMGKAGSLSIPRAAWRGTTLELPAWLGGRGLRDAITGTDIPSEARQRLDGLLEVFPIAVLVG